MELAGFLGATMLWIKAAHIIFVIFLMAGLFMMPRFFVYHQQAPVGSDEDRKWIEREDRLRRIILNPSLIIVWVFGLKIGRAHVELQSLLRSSYAVSCLKKKNKN